MDEASMDEASIDRRSFLRGGAAVVGGAAAALAGRAAWDATRPDPAPEGDEAASGSATVEFYGARQAGIATPPQAMATLVAFDLLEGVDRPALVRLMRIWTDDIARLTQGRPALADTEQELACIPASLTVTLGLGPGFFTAAGLESARPRWLAPLPAFAVDQLQDRWSAGDLVLQICADDPVTIAHTLRMLTKDARTFVRTRWVQRGFRRAAGTTPAGTTMRNLMGQVDGTRNLVPGSDDALIWHDESAPSWLVGGSSMVVRRISMDLDTWDELSRSGREAVIGRTLDTGAPLTGTREHDEPDLDALNPLGFPVIDTIAHIRRARSDDDRERILRRVYNYDDPPGAGRTSDSGLLFIAFQQDVDRQFVPIQTRLDELDLLNRWTTPVGSAVFAVPGGCAPGEYLAQKLLQA